jgi:hypothetical protein
MKRFDCDAVKERLNNKLNSQVELPKEYEFLDSIEGLDEFHTCVDEYIVRVDKSELIKK